MLLEGKISYFAGTLQTAQTERASDVWPAASYELQSRYQHLTHGIKIPHIHLFNFHQKGYLERPVLNKYNGRDQFTF